MWPALAELQRAAADAGSQLPAGIAAELSAAAEDHAAGDVGYAAAGAHIAAAAAEEALRKGASGSRSGLGLGSGLGGTASAPASAAATRGAAAARVLGSPRSPGAGAPVATAGAPQRNEKKNAACGDGADERARQAWAVCFGEGPPARRPRGAGSAFCFAGNRFVWEARLLPGFVNMRIQHGS